MGVRTGIAEAISAVSTLALKEVFHRPAANFPGKIALYVDPAIIGNMAYKLKRGSIVVAGTNGKTTVTNLLADTLERAGARVVCNRTGANLDSGVATSLLHAQEADWGVFESDEMWMGKILPYLRSDYVLLLNLFRDQLDRVGEIDRVQDSIVRALSASPETVLIYNADDPLCTAIADRCPNRTLGFGLGEDMHLAQNTVADAQMCQRCSGMLAYDYRQYGQLGSFHCTQCDFARHDPVFEAVDVSLSPQGLSFTVQSGSARGPLHAPYSGAYMVYNLLAVYVAALMIGALPQQVQQAIDAFQPDNGRLQPLRIHGRDVLLNLAKNPTGFNQNMKLVVQGEGRKAAAFFINDKEADGHDISWIWDVDFEELAASEDLVVFAGGLRKNDLQMRLKYAGIDAQLVESAAEVVEACDALPEDYSLYCIANYTALPAVREDLMRMAADGFDEPAPNPAIAPPVSRQAQQTARVPACTFDGAVTAEQPLRIVHLFPELMNLYGDGGNVRVLARRCEWRGIPFQVEQVHHGQTVDLSRADIVFLGGGPDREQHLASEELLAMRDDIRAYVENDGVLLAICGGYQILGREWLMGDETLEGLGILGITTKRAEGGSGNRLIGNIVLESPLATRPVVGYENHAGRTYLDPGVEPFGHVVGEGHGNNDDSGADGVCYRNVVASYLHGPLLGKNPEVADFLIRAAIENRTGVAVTLPPMADAVELAANSFMCHRAGVSARA
ncbi:MAG: MurT ligase domain-containing protein [Eggerthellaceae bacterium]|jgi:CobQ-like glutamine amidotransferase family enzyme/UDP-N-acetylmuramyl tripeptide synthase